MSKKREMGRTLEKVLWAHRGLGLAREEISIVQNSRVGQVDRADRSCDT